MTELGPNHLRALSVRLEAIDHWLERLECALLPIGRSPFRPPVLQPPPGQQERIRCTVETLRGALVAILREKGLSAERETVSLRAAALPFLLSMRATVEEIAPRYMRGYGALSPRAQQELEEIVSELERRVAELEEALAGGGPGGSPPSP